MPACVDIVLNIYTTQIIMATMKRTTFCPCVVQIVSGKSCECCNPQKDSPSLSLDDIQCLCNCYRITKIKSESCPNTATLFLQNQWAVPEVIVVTPYLCIWVLIPECQNLDLKNCSHILSSWVCE